MSEKPDKPTPRPKIGLALLSAEWFYERGTKDQAPDSGRELIERLNHDVEHIVQRMSAFADLVHPHVITTKAQATEAAAAFARENVDALVLCSITWSEDEPLIRILEETAGLPMLVWCFCGLKTVPDKPINLVELFHGSGPVGCLQSSGTIRKFGRGFEFVLGHYEDTGTIGRIKDFAMAAHLAQKLRSVRIGVLPYRCILMASTWVDEFALMQQIGPKLVPITIQQYVKLCEGIPTSHVGEFLNWIVAKNKVENVSPRSLDVAARTSLGLAALFNAFDLDALGFDDTNPELIEAIGLRPALCVPEMYRVGRVVSMEADIPAVTAMYMISRLTDSLPMYTELQNFDISQNAALFSHAGMHDWRLADEKEKITIGPDPEFVEANELEGAFPEYRVKAGPVALVNFVDAGHGLAMTAATGESLEVSHRIAGFPHAWVRLDPTLLTFFEQAVRAGVTQHWILVHDPAVLTRLAILARLKNFSFTTIS